MTDDTWLIASVGVVWVMLATLYAFVPLFHMPGSAKVWGAGALLFVALAILTAAIEARARRHLANERATGASRRRD